MLSILTVFSFKMHKQIKAWYYNFDVQNKLFFNLVGAV